MKRLYPLAPLAALAGLEVHQLASRLHLSGSTWQQYRDEGVSERVADRMAVRLGFDPYVVWPEMLDHAIEDTSKPCAREGCDARFMPVNSLHRYCSARCKKKENMRAWRRTDAGRKWENEARRRRYQETAEYERARERRRYWADPEAQRARMRARRAEPMKPTVPDCTAHDEA